MTDLSTRSGRDCRVVARLHVLSADGLLPLFLPPGAILPELILEDGDRCLLPAAPSDGLEAELAAELLHGLHPSPAGECASEG
jgi:hypothetical protein